MVNFAGSTDSEKGRGKVMHIRAIEVGQEERDEIVSTIQEQLQRRLCSNNSDDHYCLHLIRRCLFWAGQRDELPWFPRVVEPDPPSQQ